MSSPSTHQKIIFTIGHSTHSMDEFLALLAKHNIQAVVDIRRFPGSRKFPHFAKANLETALRKAGIDYHWLQYLGGRRQKPTAGSPPRNLGLRNESFRNYADYMRSEQFHEGIERLLEIAQSKPTAYMCAEGLFWRCHRRLVSDFLLVRGIDVQHIMPSGELRPHTLTSGATIDGDELSYPPAEQNRGPTLFD